MKRAITAAILMATAGVACGWDWWWANKAMPAASTAVTLPVALFEWRFNGTNGQTVGSFVADSSPNNNVLTRSGNVICSNNSAYVPAPVMNSVSTTLFNNASAWSVAGWIYPLSGALNNFNFLVKTASGESGKAGFAAQTVADGVNIRGFHNQEPMDSAGNVKAPYSTWMHVGATFTTNNGGVMIMYSNGVPTYTDTTWVANGPVSNAMKSILFRPSTGITNFTDDCAGWTQVLAAAEMLLHYTTTSNSVLTGTAR
jgi:hypothetical protein